MNYSAVALCVSLIATELVADTSLDGTTSTPIMPSQLNAFPSRYSGHTVVVQGYANIGPENDVLYELKSIVGTNLDAK